MRDHGLQDGIDSINENKKANVVSQRVIDRETVSIAKRISDNENTNKKLKEKYNISVNQ